MEWTFLYMMVFLKLPILALLGIVWWAIRHEPDPDGEATDETWRPTAPRHPRRPLPRRPSPRRGPHGAAPPCPPARVRTTVARSRSLDR